MKQLYIECNMGAAGDMLMSALCELLPNPDVFIDKMNKLNLPGVRLIKETKNKCGIRGTYIRVEINGMEEHPAVLLPSHSLTTLTDTNTPVSEEAQKALKALEAIEGLKNVRIYTPETQPGQSFDAEAAVPASSTSPQKQGLIVRSTPASRHYTTLSDINRLIAALPLSENVKNDAIAVYELLAEAESAVHGYAAEQIHFHEVGNMDAIADIIGVCLLIEELDVERISASPIHVGCGQIQCAHGILPVPAPATAYLLKGIPTYGGSVQGELCTPTGAALLKYFVEQFGSQPLMSTEKIGYGMGSKDFGGTDCVRTFLGKTPSEKDGGPNDSIIQLSCNLDDMTGEAIGFACELLWQAGALDVWTTSIQMKKNRPGQILSCLCKAELANDLAVLILRHTTTWGVRKTVCDRYCMKSDKTSVETEYGSITLKEGYGYGIYKTKPEYEDVAQIAKEEQLPFCEVYHRISR